MTDRPPEPDGMARVIPLRSRRAESPNFIALPAQPEIGSVVRFHVGHPFGGYHFAAINRGRHWKTTSQEKVEPSHWPHPASEGGPILHPMSWEEVRTRTRRLQVATQWEDVSKSEPVRKERSVIRFKRGNYFMVAICGVQLRPDWYTSVDNPSLPAFAITSWSVIQRAATQVQLATEWLDLVDPDHDTIGHH
jgi:hypothetical protein